MKKIILTILCFLSLTISARAIHHGGCYPVPEIIPNASFEVDSCDDWTRCRAKIGYKNDPDILIRDPNWNKYDNENLGKDLF